MRAQQKTGSRHHLTETKRTVRVHPSALYREVQGEVVLLQLDTGEYYGLNEVSARIWQLIVETGNLDLVEAAILREFEVDPAVLAKDLQTLVDDLITRQLIER
jgi:Coenzyme PQQ synthesis protein D (PqqD)